MVLRIEQGLIDTGRLADRLNTVFSVRGTHALPPVFPTPPAAWRRDYASLVVDLDVDARTLQAAQNLLDAFWRDHINPS